MKQYLIFLFIICSLQVPFVSANWYGPAGGIGAVVQNGFFIENKNVNAGMTWCIQDGDIITGGYPPNAAWNWGAPAPNQGNYDYDTRAYNHDATRIRCQRWDASSPESLSVSYTTGWTNTGRVITVQTRDRGGSTLKRILLQQSTNGGAWQDVGDWDNLPDPTNTLITRTFTRSVIGQNSNSFQYRIQAFDYAGNQAMLTNPGLIQVDTQAPLASDISNTLPANGASILAEPSRIFSLTVGINGGSPIVETTGYFEDRTTINSFIATAFTSLSGNFSHTFDIRNVDLNRLGTGERIYSLKITRVCDQAGNCTIVGNNNTSAPGITNYTYNVYANTLFPTTSIISNALTNIGNIADGDDVIQIRLRDIYGNIIIPTSGSMLRNISFATTVNNNLRLNQYDLTSTASALFNDISSGTGTINLGASTKSFGNKASLTGDYNLSYFVFAPTSNTSPLVTGSANVTNITFSSTGLGPMTNSVISGSNFSIIAQPLFLSSMTGSIRTQGFIEGVDQTGNLTVTKANTTSTSGNNIYFEFGNYNSGTALNESNNRYNLSLSNTNIREGYSAGVPSSTNVAGISLANGTYNLNSRLLLQSGSVNTSTISYLANIIRYVIDGKTVIYPYDIIGKTSYFGVAGTNNSYQAGIKILGTTSSQNTQELTTNQFNGDVRIVGNIEKSLARKDIQTNVYQLIRNIPPKGSGALILSSGVLQASTWGTTTRGVPFYSNNAIYFATGVTLQAASNIEGNKTLVVEGDIYITGNIRDSDNDSILGIIALSKNGLGGNIYIDPSVTDIHAILYADKSLISYDGTKEFDGANSNASELRHQLYIKGSVFTENTIGGSRKTPIACPYFVNILCTQEIAQKYDMNYLRRYYRYDSNADGTLDTNSGNQSYAGGATAGSRSAEFQENPVIIEYDSRLQQTPPPLFGK